MKPFQDRNHAGFLLARALKEQGLDSSLVLGIPRGGLLVAAAVATQLGKPLDILAVRKLRTPHHPELAIGAVNSEREIIFNDAVFSRFGISDALLQEEVETQVRTIREALLTYRGQPYSPVLEQQSVLIVDDGAATGATLMAAIAQARNGNARHITVGLPVCSPQAAQEITRESDAFLCLNQPPDMQAVSQYYSDFLLPGTAILTQTVRHVMETYGHGRDPEVATKRREKKG